MKLLLKNSFLPNRKNRFLFLYLVLITTFVQAQTVNYISNGGFEEVVTNTSTPLFYSAKYWGGIDSIKYYGELLSSAVTPVKVPLTGYTYQWPRHGNNHLISSQYSLINTDSTRGYPRNRLKKVLKANTSYCFSMYVNLSNQSSYGIDALGVYFADNSIDTISKCTIPITYLTPQISNTANNIIADTLRWILIQGQFSASGTEKYALIGNYKSNTNTNKLLVNPTHAPAIFSEYLIDDVSLIESDLPVFAGRDTSIFVGDSIYLGRESDVGIDEACLWYKLPAAITPTTPAIDTIAGFWIKPTVTEKYVVRQEICGNVKWDTVTIYIDAVGLKEQSYLNENVKIYPVPAKDQFEIDFTNEKLSQEFTRVSIYNNLGQLLREEELVFVSGSVKVSVEELANGVYFIKINNQKNEAITKKLLIAK